MKRSWLIGAALVLSLTAVGCKDDDDEDKPTTGDAGADAGSKTDAGGGGGPIIGIDGGVDAGSLDAKVPTSDAGGDAGDAH
ncbi:MAG: hypothetical protein RLZZ450_7077 [Pseudomonadota bacterium]|jgi:hypothetical protein